MMLVPKCIYPKCIFATCIRLACLLSFASLFKKSKITFNCEEQNQIPVDEDDNFDLYDSENYQKTSRYIMIFESVQRSRAEQNLSWFDKCLLQDVAFSANVKLLEANSSVYFEEPFQYRIHSAMVR